DYYCDSWDSSGTHVLF
nr:immunoglobulin light chain junction region [Macaca mulatta]MOW36040.1 immunoglobulin light chain junction region [Macaca mulatta]MOW36575.1 immunoglobulin light chain junction region [Macaca mulatta]MOX79496.1 immunoglobulin light chain junction region [Macaca mulatta]MOX83115.1 immunoglobulin light chain junction region [Macaca mulatta]